MRFVVVALCLMVAFGAGMLSGWDSGVRDGKAMFSCETGE